MLLVIHQKVLLYSNGKNAWEGLIKFPCSLYVVALLFVLFINDSNLFAKTINPYTAVTQSVKNNKLFFLNDFLNESKNAVINQYIEVERDDIYSKTKLSLIIDNKESGKHLIKLLKSNEFGDIRFIELLHYFYKKDEYLFLTQSAGEYTISLLNSELQIINSYKVIPQGLKPQYSKIQKIELNTPNILFFTVEGSLFRYKLDEPLSSLTLIDENVVDLANNVYQQMFFYLKDQNIFFSVIKCEINQNGEVGISEVGRSEFSLFYQFFVSPKKHFIYILNGFENNTLLSVIDINERKTIHKIWLEGSLDLYKIGGFYSKDGSNKNLLVAVKINSSDGLSGRIDFFDLNTLHGRNKVLQKVSERVFDNPLTEIVNSEFYEDRLIILTKNEIILFDEELNLLVEDILLFKQTTNDNEGKQTFINYNPHFAQVLIRTGELSYLLDLKRNNLWYFNRLYSGNGKYFIPILLLLVVIYYVMVSRRQKRLINTLLELPGTGFIFVFDKSGGLLSANLQARELLKFDYNIPLKKYFKYYCNSEFSLPLFDFFLKAFHTQTSFAQRVNLVVDDKLREYFCHSNVVRSVTGNFNGLIVTGVDITEELERQRLSNWAQLAHDLQTNLSIIRLNAENLESSVPINQQSKVKKISQQTNIILNRIRDLVTVGRSPKINKLSNKSSEIVQEIIHEFDLSLIPGIEIRTQVTEFGVYCDKPKLIRCLRNALENAIKVLQQKGGIITLHSLQDRKNAIFIVEDNGPGMDENIKSRMLSPFFTTNQDDNGSGIGTMIMLNVMEQHGGNLFVESEKGKGTKMIFKFPNLP